MIKNFWAMFDTFLAKQILMVVQWYGIEIPGQGVHPAVMAAIGRAKNLDIGIKVIRGDGQVENYGLVSTSEGDNPEKQEQVRQANERILQRNKEIAEKIKREEQQSRVQ